MELIGEQITGDLSTLSTYQSRLGDVGEVRIYLDKPLSQEQIDKIQNDIISQGGVLNGDVTQDAGMLIIPFVNTVNPGIGALPILLIVAGVVAVVAGGILGWQIFQASSDTGIPTWVWVFAGVFLLYKLAKTNTGQKLIGTGTDIGRIYATRKLSNPRRKK
jgi:hypothetical protein